MKLALSKSDNFASLSLFPLFLLLDEQRNARASKEQNLLKRL